MAQSMLIPQYLVQSCHILATTGWCRLSGSYRLKLFDVE